MSKHGATFPTMQYDCNMSCCPENEVKEVRLAAFPTLAFGSCQVYITGKTGKLNDVAQLKKWRKVKINWHNLSQNEALCACFSKKTGLNSEESVAIEQLQLGVKFS